MLEAVLALVLAQCPCADRCGCTPECHCGCLWNYEHAIEYAVKRKMPLVTFVGCSPRVISGAVSTTTVSIWDSAKPRIVVGSPEYWIGDLEPNASDETIIKLMRQPPPKITPPQVLGTWSGGSGSVARTMNC